MKKDKYNRNDNFSLFHKRFPLKHIWGIKENILCIVDDIKVLRQRAKYGISKRDTWDFNSYLLTIIENALKVLEQDRVGYPLFCTDEEWQVKLQYMRKLSEISNMENDYALELFDKYMNLGFEFGEDDERVKKAKNEWLEEERAFDRTVNSARYKLLKEITKYIDELWD